MAHNNLHEWLKRHEKDFTPPVCLKTMYNSQLTMLFIRGPNQREDFHIEEGEEIFYMIEGEMNLKVIENNKFRNINIKEGEIFVLPARVRHSPRRPANSLGFVVERGRIKDIEYDGLMYYDEKTTSDISEPFHEVYGYISDKFESEIKNLVSNALDDIADGNVTSTTNGQVKRMVTHDDKARIYNPIHLASFVKNNKDILSKNGCTSIFPNKCQSQVDILSNGEHLSDSLSTDVIFWVHSGKAALKIDGEPLEFKCNDFYLLKAGNSATLVLESGSLVLRLQIIPN